MARDVLIRLNRLSTTGKVPANAAVRFEPTVLRADADGYILDDYFDAVMVDGEATVTDLPETDLNWAYKVQIRGHGRGAGLKQVYATWYVHLPAGEGTVNFEDLPRIDPTTLTPVNDPDPAWVAAVTAVFNDSVSTAVEPAMVTAAEDETSQFRSALNAASVQSVQDTMGLVLAGQTFDHARLQSAATEAELNGKRLWAAGTITTDQTLMIRSDFDLGGLTYRYSGPGVAVQFGVEGSNTHRLTGVFPRVIHTGKKMDGSGWGAVAGTVGILVLNTYSSAAMTVPFVSGFETGLQVEGRGGRGNVHNTFFLGHLYNNKRNLHLIGSTGGWSNQNIFVGGRYSHEANEGAFVPGVEQVLMNHTETHKPDNNLFLNPSLEGFVAQYVLSVAGQENMIINGRYEALETLTVRWLDNSQRNQILNGWRSYLLEEQFGTNTGTNTIHSAIVRHSMSGMEPLYQITNTSEGGPALAVYHRTARTQGADPATAWNVQLADTGARFKNREDTAARVRIANNIGRVYFGDGTAVEPVSVGINGTDKVGIYGGDLVFPNGHSIGTGTGGGPMNAHIQQTAHIGTSVKFGNAGTLPTAGSGYRGEMRYVRGALGVPDALYVCMKTAADGWEWKQVA